ncbi:MAG: aldo/keto reductase, partial [Bacteroidota bacterium]
EAKSAGMGVIVKEALANGRLTERNQSPTFQAKKQRLAQTAAEYEVSLDALALGLVQQQSFVDVVLSGAAQIDHLLSNLKSTDLPVILEAEELLEAMSESPATYWKTRKSLDWN